MVVEVVVAAGGGRGRGIGPPSFGETGVLAVGVWAVDGGVYMVADPDPVVVTDVEVCIPSLLGLEFVDGDGRGAEDIDDWVIPARLGPCK